ncbi:MAG: 2-oxo-4-hydroxy-4-carboxy-5-ureidoimidazoline decarboxylase [Verrucomicrobiota bacterium]|nr:2-oxo-4-hydroxy-4-carboxy-5-ureidoimidazoline decarboxylase [Verrucomicrobiota bacterium]
MSLAQINSLSREEFVRLIGSVFEHSPWITKRTGEKRPFADLDQLHFHLCQTIWNANEAEKIKLIQAHPDLVGRAALAGTLTSESTREQTSAGLNKLSSVEISEFQKFNQAYREKFNFPFVICARLNKKEAILRGFEKRLQNSRDEEIKTALEEISKIAFLRLQDIVAN